MRKVMQDRFGANGNCLQACIASILERDIGAIPDLVNQEPEDEWIIRLNSYLRGLGYGWLYVTDFAAITISNSYAIALCDVGRLYSHAVIVKGRSQYEEDNRWSWAIDIVHDPDLHEKEIKKIDALIIITKERWS